MIMTGPDAFYTPDCYAVQLLSHVVSSPRNAVDFCVGDGGLLKAAEHRFVGLPKSLNEAKKIALESEFVKSVLGAII